MNAFNRTLAIIVGLGAVCAGTVLLLVASGAVAPGDLTSSGWLGESLEDLEGLTGGEETAAIIALAGVIGAATVLLLAEVLTLGGAEPLSVAGRHGGQFVIAPRSVVRVVEEAGREVQGVQSVRPVVRRRRDRLIVSGRATLEPGVKITEVTPQLEGKIRSAVESNTGLTVAAVRLNLEHARARPPAEINA